VLCTATATIYGWLCGWDTTTVPNGTYTLVSLATNSTGGTAAAGVSIMVANPTTSILVPSNGATLSGTGAVLDASASNATSVEFLLFGGIYSFWGHLVGTAASSVYGWIDIWNTTTVPNGSYVLVSVASGPSGTTASSGVRMTVKN
jgi:chitinase